MVNGAKLFFLPSKQLLNYLMFYFNYMIRPRSYEIKLSKCLNWKKTWKRRIRQSTRKQRSCLPMMGRCPRASLKNRWLDFSNSYMSLAKKSMGLGLRKFFWGSPGEGSNYHFLNLFSDLWKYWEVSSCFWKHLIFWTNRWGRGDFKTPPHPYTLKNPHVCFSSK